MGGNARRSAWCIIATLFALAGCAVPPAPLGAPDAESVRIRLSHFRGSPLEGALAAPRAPGAPAEAEDPASALELKARVLLLSGALPPAFSRAGPRSSLLAATSGRRPFLPASPLSRDARVAPITEGDAWTWNPWESPVLRHAEPAAAWTGAGYFRSALPNDVTASVEVDVPEGFRAGADAGFLAMRVQVHRSAVQTPAAAAAAGPAGLIRVVLILEARGFPEASPDGADTSQEGATAGEAGESAVGTRTARGFDRKVFLIEDRAAPPRGGWIVAAPLCGQGFDSGMYALVAVSLGPPPAPGDPARPFHDESLARVLAELSAPDGERDLAGESPAAAAILSAVEGLRVPARQRKALSFLADATGAGVAADISITGTEALVSQLAAAVAGAAQAAPATREPGAMGWLLEKTTIEVLAALLAEKKLPPELEAVLARRAGEAGRSAAPLAGVLKGAAGLDDLRAGFVRENFIALEDASPAARVRAFDWLSARGKAPAGYDPLAAAKERRLALEKSLEIADPSAPRQP